MSDEQYPLLLVLVGDQEVSKSNKRFKGRSDGITTGASAIITEWPNYLSSCWLTALICGIALFVVSIMLTSCLTLQEYKHMPRCSSDQIFNNTTIHLIHTSPNFLKTNLDLFKNLTQIYPNYQIRILLIGRWKKMIENRTELNLPNVSFEETTFSELFQNSPLFLNWVSLNFHMKIFAARVLQIWQYGGISYDLMEYTTTIREKRNSTGLYQLKVKDFIESGLERYERLPIDMVSIDLYGYHMEAKTPCHAFFGSILQKLTKAYGFINPKEVLFHPMYNYCKMGAIDKDFCHIRHFYYK